MPKNVDILTLAARHSILTVEAVKSFVFQGKSESAARKALEASVENGHLKSFRLDTKRKKAFQLSKSAAKQLGLPKTFGTPFGERVLAERLTTLHYASLSKRTVLLRDEFNAHFTELVLENVAFEPCNYYLRQDKHGICLHRFMVDLGAAPKRVAERVIAFVQKAKSSATLSEMMEAGAFGLSLLVPTPSKREAVRKALNGGPIFNGYRLDVEIAVVQQTRKQK